MKIKSFLLHFNQILTTLRRYNKNHGTEKNNTKTRRGAIWVKLTLEPDEARVDHLSARVSRREKKTDDNWSYLWPRMMSEQLRNIPRSVTKHWLTHETSLYQHIICVYIMPLNSLTMVTLYRRYCYNIDITLEFQMFS